MSDVRGASNRPPATPAPIDGASVPRILGALAQPSRLAVFLQIVAAGPEGAPAGSLAGMLGTTGSALTLHLRALEAAELIEVRIRRGPKRSMIVVARADRCAELAHWLADHFRQGGWSLAEPDGRRITA